MYVDEEVGEEEKVAGVGDESGGDWEESRSASRAPYNYDPESRLDGQIGRHNLKHLTATSRKLRP